MRRHSIAALQAFRHRGGGKRLKAPRRQAGGVSVEGMGQLESAAQPRTVFWIVDQADMSRAALFQNRLSILKQSVTLDPLFQEERPFAIYDPGCHGTSFQRQLINARIGQAVA
jgi:hypothetical protein